MNYELLRVLRVAIPGFILIILGSIFFEQGIYTSSFFWKEDLSKLTILSYLAGSIYEIIAERTFINKWWVKKVNQKLVAEFKERFPNCGISTWKDVSPIFYELIDNDPSLGKKANAVYFNGLLMSSLSDLTIISTFFFAANMVFGGAVAWRMEGCLFFGGISLIPMVLLHFCYKRHVQLGKEQVRVMQRRFRSKAEEYFRGGNEESAYCYNEVRGSNCRELT